MKGRESGMPAAAYWNSFFDAVGVLDCLGFLQDAKQGANDDVIEFGSGYGTFSFEIARRTSGLMTALDIEPELVTQVKTQSVIQGCLNISAQVRDFLAHGTGLEDNSQNAAFIFNLLHIESPESLLTEAYRVLSPGGHLYVIHWRSDIDTPRGPPLEIRPRPEDCIEWMQEEGFVSIQVIDLGPAAPYHYGISAKKP